MSDADSYDGVREDVRGWFQAVDRDGSGQITAKELQAALANGQGGTFSEKACRLMIGMFDKEQRGTIAPREFQALFDYVNQWVATFRSFDRDDSGAIQESELSAAFAQMGFRFSPEFAAFLIRKSDPKERRSATIDQFIVLCVQIQRLTEAFKTRDTDRTGTISIGFEDFVQITLDLCL